ncbi:hypothetical protein BDZ45DRAFT_803839 [Acephala macrosclerotiorum]|nr:hypothetical protein BDZ45DRAFT_803839 [Acephala macrosclerotiorum]
MSADGCVASTKTLVALNSLNHGITMSADGNFYWDEAHSRHWHVQWWCSYHSNASHWSSCTKPACRASRIERQLATGRAIVKVFDLSAVPASGYSYVSGGYVMGYGMRNEVSITFDGNNMLQGVIKNSRDNLARGGKDIHRNNPAETLNYAGDITKSNNNWYGYPTFFAVWQASDFSDTKLQVGEHFVVSPNSTFKEDNCKTLTTTPALTFMASWHTPLPSTTNLTSHIPTSSSPSTGTDGLYKPIAPSTNNAGYTDVISNPDVTKCAGNSPSFSSGCFRPAGLLLDTEGRLYMTSDTTSQAELWVLGKS